MNLKIREYVAGENANIAVVVNDYGECDVLDFIEGLSESDQRKVVHLFRLFCERGEIRNEEKFKHEAGKIFALKSFQVRILAAFLPASEKRTLVLLHAFKKKSDKLKASDLERAQALYEKTIKISE